MSHVYFRSAGLLTSLILMGFGINGLTRPFSHLSSLNFPAHPENSTAQDLNRALMRIWGVRNVTVSALLLLLYTTTSDDRLYANALGITSLLPIVDGFVSRGLTGAGEGQHWAFPPIIGVIVAGLYGAFEGK